MTDGRGAPEREPEQPDSRRRRWWWWLLVGAIALVVAVLLVRGGNEDPATGADAVPETPSLEPADPTHGGAMTIGGEGAQPLLEAGDISTHAGEEVLASRVPVDSIIAEGVYWVGEGEHQLLVIEPEGQGTPVQPGSLLTFRGTLRALDDDARSAVWGTEAERTIESQGAYVAVDELDVDSP